MIDIIGCIAYKQIPNTIHHNQLTERSESPMGGWGGGGHVISRRWIWWTCCKVLNNLIPMRILHWKTAKKVIKEELSTLIITYA